MIIISLLATFALVTSPLHGLEPITPEDYQLFMEIQKSIEAVGKKHNKTPEEIHRIYQRVALTADTIPKFGKGGVSSLREDVYIVNNNKKNELILGGNQWIGNTGNSPELVILTGHKVLGTFPISNLPSKDDFIFVVFNGEQAKYFDWKTLSGAVTYRH
jgi:hypothetical protein